MIIVTGTPRAGTTFMQWFLSQHPKVHIHGQEPKVNFSQWFSFLDRMIESGEWGIKSNKSNDVKEYPVLHYSGSDQQRCEAIFRQMFKEFITGFGPNKPNWGAKFLWCVTKQSNVDRFTHLWPDVKWVVCLRDPFVSFNSQKNTFVKDQDINGWLERWIATAEFALSHKCILFQIDKLQNATKDEKEQKLNTVLSYIGETPSKETDSFISDWPTVHKVRQNKDRTFAISDKRREEMIDKHPKIISLMQQLGY